MGSGQKNKAKAEFTMMLFADKGKWEDSYWEAATEDTHAVTAGSSKTWILRSKAETEHGGGERGKQDIDNAVAAGIYQERTIFQGRDKEGKVISVKQIMLNEQHLHVNHTFSLTEKNRIGGQSSTDQFKEAVAYGFADIGASQQSDAAAGKVKKKPAAQKPQLSIKDTGADSEEDDTDASDCTVMKKPTMKEESANGDSESNLTQQNVTQHNAELMAQNDDLNRCLAAAQTLLQKQEMQNKRILNDANASDAIHESKKRLKKMHVEELSSLTEGIVQSLEEINDANLTKGDVQHSNLKIDALDRAHDLINESKDVAKHLIQMMNKGSESSATGSRSTKRRV